MVCCRIALRHPLATRHISVQLVCPAACFHAASQSKVQCEFQTCNGCSQHKQWIFHKPALHSSFSLSCRLLFLSDCRILYVESIARVRKLSLSGYILYFSRMADQFFVQWPELQARFPRSTYAGRLY
jgi:hypothetical protein